MRGEYERTSARWYTEQGVCIRSSTRLTWRKLTRTFYFWLFLLVELEKHSSPSKPVCVLMMEKNEQSVITKSVMNGPFFMYWLLLPDDGTSSSRNW